MKYISAHQVDALLDYPSLIEALHVAHRGDKPIVGRSELHFERDADTRQSFLNLPAWLPGEAMGIKSIAVMPGNETAHDLPTVHAVYLVFDGQTGVPVATIDGTALTLRKTAADSALGANLLARADISTMLMVGAGAMAHPLVSAHRAVRPSLREVLVWNRTRAKADHLAEALREEGLEAQSVDDLEPASRRADLICCATSATVPHIRGEWLQPGTHLDLVGSFTPDMRESDDEAVRRADVFVDSRWYAIHEPGDIAQPLGDGVIEETDILGDLYDLCGETHGGRHSDTAITLFKNGGGAHLDLYTALHLLRRIDEAP
jgi:ornithine cyclodeaminase